jgi:hypothetical protein
MIIDGSDDLFRDISTHIVKMAPTSLTTNALEKGLLIGLDLYPASADSTQHKSKTLDQESPTHLRIKSCSFNFCMDKLKPQQKGKRSALLWADNLFNEMLRSISSDTHLDPDLDTNPSVLGTEHQEIIGLLQNRPLDLIPAAPTHQESSTELTLSYETSSTSSMFNFHKISFQPLSADTTLHTTLVH